MRNQDGARIFGEYLGEEILLQDASVGLELTAYDGDESVTVTLSRGATRELRLALQDAEKRQKSTEDTGGTR